MQDIQQPGNIATTPGALIARVSPAFAAPKWLQRYVDYEIAFENSVGNNVQNIRGNSAAPAKH